MIEASLSIQKAYKFSQGCIHNTTVVIDCVVCIVWICSTRKSTQHRARLCSFFYIFRTCFTRSALVLLSCFFLFCMVRCVFLSGGCTPARAPWSRKGRSVPLGIDERRVVGTDCSQSSFYMVRWLQRVPRRARLNASFCKQCMCFQYLHNGIMNKSWLPDL
jgi:hypothetical protein